MRITPILLIVFLLVGCTVPRPQRGGSTTTTLGGNAQPTTVTTTAPENPQTPTTTTIEKTTTRDFVADAERGARNAERQTESTPRSAGVSPAPSVQPSAFSVQPSAAPRLMRETVVERATTQIGTSQDLAGILKAWGSATATHYKALLWAAVLCVAAWRAWKREWPLIAAVLGIGAVLSLLVAWWVGPVAAGAAALIWAAYHVARGQLPLPPSTP